MAEVTSMANEMHGLNWMVEEKAGTMVTNDWGGGGAYRISWPGTTEMLHGPCYTEMEKISAL